MASTAAAAADAEAARRARRRKGKGKSSEAEEATTRGAGGEGAAEAPQGPRERLAGLLGERGLEETRAELRRRGQAVSDAALLAAVDEMWERDLQYDSPVAVSQFLSKRGGAGAGAAGGGAAAAETREEGGADAAAEGEGEGAAEDEAAGEEEDVAALAARLEAVAQMEGVEDVLGSLQLLRETAWTAGTARAARESRAVPLLLESFVRQQSGASLDGRLAATLEGLLLAPSAGRGAAGAVRQAVRQSVEALRRAATELGAVRDGGVAGATAEQRALAAQGLEAAARSVGDGLRAVSVRCCGAGADEGKGAALEARAAAAKASLEEVEKRRAAELRVSSGVDLGAVSSSAGAFRYAVARRGALVELVTATAERCEGAGEVARVAEVVEAQARSEEAAAALLTRLSQTAAAGGASERALKSKAALGEVRGELEAALQPVREAEEKLGAKASALQARRDELLAQLQRVDAEAAELARERQKLRDAADDVGRKFKTRVEALSKQHAADAALAHVSVASSAVADSLRDLRKLTSTAALAAAAGGDATAGPALAARLADMAVAWASAEAQLAQALAKRVVEETARASAAQRDAATYEAMRLEAVVLEARVQHRKALASAEEDRRTLAALEQQAAAVVDLLLPLALPAATLARIASSLQEAHFPSALAKLPAPSAPPTASAPTSAPAPAPAPAAAPATASASAAPPAAAAKAATGARKPSPRTWGTQAAARGPVPSLESASLQAHAERSARAASGKEDE